MIPIIITALFCIFGLLYVRHLQLKEVAKVRLRYVDEIKSLQRILDESLNEFKSQMTKLTEWAARDLPGDVSTIFFSSKESKVIKSRLKLNEQKYYELMTPLVQAIQQELTIYIQDKSAKVSERQAIVIKDTLNERTQSSTPTV